MHRSLIFLVYIIYRIMFAKYVLLYEIVGVEMDFVLNLLYIMVVDLKFDLIKW